MEFLELWDIAWGFPSFPESLLVNLLDWPTLNKIINLKFLLYLFFRLLIGTSIIHMMVLFIDGHYIIMRVKMMIDDDVQMLQSVVLQLQIRQQVIFGDVQLVYLGQILS